MRIARVLLASGATPIVALERDGCLYDVAELERLYDTPYSPERFAKACDFHTRVIALSCAGLDTLDERLCAGDRPTEARILPDTFLWLAPCATDRAAYVQMGPYRDPARPRAEEPHYWLGCARNLLGHEATVCFPAREAEPDFEVGVAAILGEDLRRATAEDTARAILGYSILNDWTARDEERRGGGSRAKDFATQLGPVLVTKDEIGDVRALRVAAKAPPHGIDCSTVGAHDFTIAERVAFVSEHIELCAGDVIGAGCVLLGSAAAHGRRVSYGSTIELTIERLGRLTGRPVRGPEPVWARQAERS
jgi:2-keto-4-pentenoate hydratase/2-oxohepta-3-ene-1,7-dioic acid hydratase in catechol pathway